VTSSSRQLPDLDRYLARHGFAAHPVNSTWLDHGTGQGIIRVVREPEEETQLICLAPHSVCLYKAAFSLSTPDAVITAALEAALSPPPPQAGRRRARQATGQRRAQEGSGDLR
jgi:hypothetical protein